MCRRNQQAKIAGREPAAGHNPTGKMRNRSLKTAGMSEILTHSASLKCQSHAYDLMHAFIPNEFQYLNQCSKMK